MSQPFDLVAAGRPSLDVIFSGLHEWPALGKDIESDGLGVCAGRSFNTPAAANRIGMRVAYVATVGNDPWSRLIRVERIDARHLHAYADEAPELEAAAHRRGMTVSLDAWGGPWWSSPRPLAEMLAHADVLFANEAEVAAMTGEAEPRRALERAAEGCRCDVIKRGAAGAMGLAGGQVRTVPADPVPTLDTTGVGDCFNARFIAGWLGGLPLEESLTLGVICGSRAIGDHGGYRGCPREAELRAVAAAPGIALPRREAATQGEPT
jgi:sugar/nucleoside kinase (ribokinase family)